MMAGSERLIRAAEVMRKGLRGMKFSEPVAAVYNPLEYAWERHREYLERFGAGRKRVLFLGMNPGPYGMAQTGVPFGEVAAVRDWMGISGEVGRPEREHPKRPISGFGCERSEVSGRRLWGLFAELYGTAEEFFRNHFVVNFCPLIWMSATGANLTPDKLSRDEMGPVEEVCREHLAEVIGVLEPEILVGVGGFAEKQLAAVRGGGEVLGKILHPSPASPAANRDFLGVAERQLRDLGVL